MVHIEHDEKGFTCLCGQRNDYPDYVQDHRSVKLVYSCPCHRRYLLFKGTVTTTSRESAEVSDSEAFGD